MVVVHTPPLTLTMTLPSNTSVRAFIASIPVRDEAIGLPAAM